MIKLNNSLFNILDRFGSELNLLFFGIGHNTIPQRNIILPIDNLLQPVLISKMSLHLFLLIGQLRIFMA